MFVATINEGARGLPDRDLHLNEDERSLRLRSEYLAHITRMFELIGETRDAAAQTAQGVMAVEAAIARASYSRVQMRDPQKRYNPMSMAAVANDLQLLSQGRFVLGDIHADLADL